MTKENGVLAAEDRFFDALLDGNGEALRAVLTPDFVLIDVMTGSEIPGSVLVQGESMIDPLSRPDAGLEAIREFFRAATRYLTEENPRRGCLVANTITERGSDDAASMLRCNLSREQLERGFRRALGQARNRGELPPHLDVDATATLLVIQNYGLSALAKTGATLEELEAATEALLAGLE